jgi:NAD(P)-dependent dehydrogenase (short-subunit alcohol dehydrogenase family)
MKMEFRLPDLRDWAVVVTGGARGMGRAYARAFLSEGAKVALADRTWAPYADVEDGVSDFKEELRSHADRALKLEMDVTSDQQIDQAYQEVLAHFGTVDVLINNAAMRTRDLYSPMQRQSRITTLETADADWKQMFGVNVFGVLKVTRRFIQPMLDKQRGSIVNIVSSGIVMQAHGGSYVALLPHSREMPSMASKAALVNLSFYLADEVRGSNGPSTRSSRGTRGPPAATSRNRPSPAWTPVRGRRGWCPSMWSPLCSSWLGRMPVASLGGCLTRCSGTSNTAWAAVSSGCIRPEALPLSGPAASRGSISRACSKSFAKR